MKVRRIFWLICILAVAVVGAYSNSFQGDFIMDDYGRIVENAYIHDFFTVAQNVTTRYLVDLTFALDYMLGGLNPAYYHFTNILIHLGCSILLFAVVRILMVSSMVSERKAEWTAFCAAILWGVHPLTTSAVTYICQRYESMMSLFYLLAILCLAAGIRAAGVRRRCMLSLSVVSCLCGVLCKQVMITAPFVLLLVDVIYFSGSIRSALRQRWLYYIGLLSSWVLLGLLIHMDSANHAAIFGAYSAERGIGMYLINQAPVLLHYLRLSFYPSPLLIDYAWLPLVELRPLLIPVALVAALFSVTAYGLYRWPKGFFAGACVFIILSPTSSVIPVPDLAFEQRMYLPLAGLIVSLVLAVGCLLKERKSLVVGVVLAGFAAGCLGAGTFLRNKEYAAPGNMWAAIAVRAPHNFRAWTFLISDMLSRGRNVEAELAARRMLARVDMAAVDHSGRFNIPSSNPDLYKALGGNLLGRALLGQAKYVAASTQFARLLESHPEDTAVRHNHALALLGMGRTAEAEREIDEVLRIDAGHRPAKMVKAGLLAGEGSQREAVGVYESILAESPDFIPARVELAWLLAISPDASIRDGEKAMSLLVGIEEDIGIPNIRIYDVKAAVLAEQGDFRGAAELQSVAVELAEKHYAADDPRRDELKDRLQIYRSGLPFRQERVSVLGK